jgi:ferric-dicitrate binding protein FerR (iron transport regulator)
VKDEKDDELNRYLWDKSGAPDPELERLEGLLGRFRHDEAAHPLRPFPAKPLSFRKRIGAFRWLAAVALGATAVVVLAVYFSIHTRLQWQPDAPWSVVATAGSPTIDGTAIGGSGQLPVGQVLQTDGSSRAEVQVGRIGVVEVQSNTTVRLLETRSGHHRVALAEGTISARIWAPPHSFAVQTASSTAFDLGCAFTLEANKDGYGLVRVTSGWVQFELDERESLVPAGAEAVTRPGLGPGTPYFSDTSEAFKTALAQFDTSGGDPAARSRALTAVLAAAHKGDSISLMNLFRKIPAAERGRVFDRLSRFTPPPADVTRESVIALDQNTMNAWWRNLERGLGVGAPKNWIINWKDSLR